MLAAWEASWREGLAIGAGPSEVAQRRGSRLILWFPKLSRSCGKGDGHVRMPGCE